PLLADTALARRARIWDPRGRLAVPLAAWLLDRRQPAAALAWLERRVVPPQDRPYRDGLLIEVHDALQDSATAGPMALRLANREPRHRLWNDLALRGALHLFHHHQYGAALVMLDRRAARSRDETIRTLWLRFRIWDAAPHLVGPEEIHEIVLRLSELGCNRRQVKRLADAYEKWLEEDWRPAAGKMESVLGVLLAARRDRRALGLLRSATQREEAAPGGLAAQVADSWRRRGRRDAALTLADSMLALSRVEQRAELLLVRARIHRSRGDLEAMAQDAWAIWRLSDDRGLAGLALWELGRETEDLGDAGAAEAVYRTLAGRPAEGRRARDAALRVGALRLALGQAERALSWWDSLGVGGPGGGGPWPALGGDGETLAQAWYWRGRALEELGRRDEAAACWQRTGPPRITGYYSWLARRARTALDAGRHSQTLWAVWTQEARGDSSAWRPQGWPEPTGIAPASETNAEAWRRRVLRWRLWHAVGRGGWAASERAQAAWESLSKAARVTFLHAAGETFAGLRLALTLANDTLRARLSHPPAYAGPVVDHGLRFGVSPYLIWAVMRQESAMDPRAVSRAGAVGLLQLMPPTAGEVGARWGLPSGPLTSPERNIPLGVAHMVEALEDDLSLPEALAAYNAGPGNARRWREEGGALDLYIERIGYRETRGYVKRVLRDYEVYRSLCAGD
ncbi:MAG: transglycosylase SLT domain-containing protein, partial [Candidatus Eisenbacteria bacterium]|nr:transglycosylase SLT domain-containing protein [Candidatus Eisenbacteria bacterium]